MDDLLAARGQMALSLAFHIIFAIVGMGMPLLMVLAEWLYRRRGDLHYLELAKRWSKGTAIMFAVGAVSGTVLSFELGLLWPGFMAFAGPVIGMPFSLEGFAFFLEAIFLGIYLYGWERVSPRAHLAAGVMVLLSGSLSAVFVLCANAWMNTPQGFALVDGMPAEVDLWAAMLNPASLPEGLHMLTAAFCAVGFAVAGIHAAALLRGRTPDFHRRALGIAFAVGGVAAFLTPLTGHVAAEQVAHTQPVKLAAMEGQWDDERGAPLRLFGLPDEAREVTEYAIEVPKLLSFIAYADFDAEVKGLRSFPADERPPVAVTHLAFQVMILAGMAMMGVAALGGLALVRRRRLADTPGLLRLIVLASPLGVVAIEAGWTVTEVGRQPWVIYKIMRTAEAVTPMPGLWIPFTTFTALYLFLGAAVVVLLRRQVWVADHPEAEVAHE
ncbi:MAG: cytochrome ubiquinol oxidase subunit I [Nannocystaceae bacterium]